MLLPIHLKDLLIYECFINIITAILICAMEFFLIGKFYRSAKIYRSEKMIPFSGLYTEWFPYQNMVAYCRILSSMFYRMRNRFDLSVKCYRSVKISYTKICIQICTKTVKKIEGWWNKEWKPVFSGEQEISLDGWRWTCVPSTYKERLSEEHPVEAGEGNGTVLRWSVFNCQGSERWTNRFVTARKMNAL